MNCSNFPNSTPPPPQSDRDTLLDDAVEYVCRTSDDPSWVEAILTTTPATSAAAALVGKFIGPNGNLDPQSPLAAWAQLGTYNPNWREHCPTAPLSLHSSWALLTGQTSTPPGRELYRQWCAASSSLDDTLDTQT